jgi:hypothetical protein
MLSFTNKNATTPINQLVEAHRAFIESFLLILVNHLRKNNNIKACEKIESLFNKFNPKEDFFSVETEENEEKIYPILLLIKNIIGSQPNNSDLELFVTLIFSPYLANGSYGYKHKDLGFLFQENSQISEFIFDQNFITAITIYVDLVNKILKEDFAITYSFNKLKLVEIKKIFLCSNVKKMEQRYKKLKQDDLALYERTMDSHNSLYSSSLKYPHQYFVMLALLLKCWLAITLKTSNYRSAIKAANLLLVTCFSSKRIKN